MKPHDYPQQPADLWEHFYRITQIPRPSKHEAAVRDYLIGQADARGFGHTCDEAGNLLVRVPASPGREGHPTVVIQNHLDMVTVKKADSPHDFLVDPLQLAVRDGWLGATGTTLGADNGIGCAAAAALMTASGVDHPPLELLFTVDEETGLGGALNLDAGMLSGSLMLNLDTEDWNELYVGCAGGAGMEFTKSYSTAPVDSGAGSWELRIGGLSGGHSGIQIHEQLGNAIKLLGECLEDVQGLRLQAFDAGLAHNVIPREGRVSFSCSPEQAEALAQRLPVIRQRWLDYLPAVDAQLELTLQAVATDSALEARDSRQVLDLIAALPHGAQAYNLEQRAELVDLSINLAVLQLTQGTLFVETSFRFFDAGQSLPLRHTLMALTRAFALDVEETVGYPGWKPDFDSALLARASALHERLFASVPAVKAIHAGLECGILKGAKPDLDILSFGPTIRGAHSPTERLKIDTVAPFWQFLTALLAEI
ncbi:beta-Ala-His dipeptidase [Haliea sp. E17]|uniref:beta-Ala-His dipeptidase n=1 Tax=Haliea sp. E17 TaxID=3401576 RepID=UPI003AADEE44